MTTKYTYTGNEGLREQSDNTPFVGLIADETIRQSSITVATTATKLPTTPLSKRKTMIIKNTGTADVYIGDFSVTTTDGFVLVQGDGLNLSISDAVDVYAVVATGTGTIKILEGA